MLLAVVLIVSQADSDEFVIWKDGVPMLSPQRKAKMDRDIEKINNAEQYVLKAEINGLYPCYNCYGKPTIKLRKGEVWKYGVTINSKEGRYKKGLPAKHLVYIVEYEGRIDVCMTQEKIKIFNYALLPENLSREVKLMRPPGNKRDN